MWTDTFDRDVYHCFNVDTLKHLYRDPMSHTHDVIPLTWPKYQSKFTWKLEGLGSNMMFQNKIRNRNNTRAE